MNHKRISLGKKIALFSPLILMVVCGGLYFGMRNTTQSMVKEMCERDGGLKVFETAFISAEVNKLLSGKNGEMLIPPRSSASPNAPFFSQSDVKLLGQQAVRGGFPGIWRTEITYIQRDGNKPLASYVHYEARSMGDVRYVGACPLPQVNFANQFIKVREASK